MKTLKFAIQVGLGVVLALAIQSAVAQTTITSFPGNGQLTWTNSPGTNGFSVQWAPTVTGPWSASWQTLNSLITTSTQKTVSVPMFYRVAQGFSAQSMRGTWIMGAGSRGNTYFIAQEDGIISESAMFIARAPAGVFTVDATGRVTNTFMSWDGSVTVSGRFAGANEILLDAPFSSGFMRRLEDASRCAGAWTGTLSQTNGPGSPTNFPVTLNVDSRGLVTNLVGFSGNNIGRLFALTNGAVAGFFYTGDKNYDPYHEIRLTGILSGNSIQGTYLVDDDGSIQGSVSLTRP